MQFPARQKDEYRGSPYRSTLAEKQKARFAVTSKPGF
jgi:hypothetical protein